LILISLASLSCTAFVLFSANFSTTSVKLAVKEVALPPDVVLTGTRVRYRVPGSRKVLEMVVGGR
jgi:hypothetical protein